jgi:hypothetical protein
VDDEAWRFGATVFIGFGTVLLVMAGFTALVFRVFGVRMPPRPTRSMVRPGRLVGYDVFRVASLVVAPFLVVAGFVMLALSR